MRLIALFNLRPGVARETYEQWARSVDLPTVNALASVRSFEVLRATGMLGSQAAPPYSFIEIIDIGDEAGFASDTATPRMQAIAAAFQEMAEVVFLTTEPLV